MRGKHSIKRKRNEIFRITPAHAGKTLTKRKVIVLKKDHPRACGENRNGIRQSTKRIGSPPRMRGKRLDALKNFAHERITPAHAGKTHKEGEKNMIIEDHPRACGENTSETAYFRG